MLLPLATAGIDSLPTGSTSATPEPPARWSRFWTSPIARVDYGAGSRVPLWGEATIPADRGLTGQLRPGVTYGGATKEAAIEAARLLARETVEMSFSFRNGRTRTTQVNPAIAVLRDARAGAFWLAPLRTTVRLGDQWLDAPHTIDGPAFEGADALLRPATVLSATRDMVAVVGRDAVLTPGVWTDAPDDSLDRA
jgi:hypothetical protein